MSDILKDKKIVTYQNYQVGLTPYKIQDFKYDKSISEIIRIKENENPIRGTIILILSTYLPLNIKSKSITSKESINLIIEHFINECGNLELQEIEFIIKSGIMGKFGTIYNDISIDTICGKDGWIETYYNTERIKRPEPVQMIIEEKPSGMTIEEFYEKNAEYKERSILIEIQSKLKEHKLSINDIKIFYKIKGFDLNDFKDDCEHYCANYYKNIRNLEIDIQNFDETDRRYLELRDNILQLKAIGESNYLMIKHYDFIRDNINKIKR